MTLKNKLLNLNIVIDNEYLDKYVELIESNRDTKREKFKTQKHHIIPKYYYKSNNLEVDESKENLVNLLYKDHILAHYYLCLCSINDRLMYQNFLSIRFVVGHLICVENDLLNKLDKYQELYEKSRKYQGELELGKHTKPATNARKQKIGNANRNRRYVHKDNVLKFVRQEELDGYLEDGWKLGNPKVSKAKIGKSPSNKGKTSPGKGVKRPKEVIDKIKQSLSRKKNYYCFEINYTFKTLKDAIRTLNINRYSIYRSCHYYEKTNEPKKFSGYSFKFIYI